MKMSSISSGSSTSLFQRRMYQGMVRANPHIARYFTSIANRNIHNIVYDSNKTRSSYSGWDSHSSHYPGSLRRSKSTSSSSSSSIQSVHSPTSPGFGPSRVATRSFSSSSPANMADIARGAKPANSDEHYDIITIGSGGGAKISTPAANLGLKVAMIEHGYDVDYRRGRNVGEDVQQNEHLPGLGGTCLNRGCIPSKMLIHPADVVQEIKEAKKYFGINAEYKGIDFEDLVKKTSASVDGDSSSIWNGYQPEKNKIIERKHLYDGTAKFIGEKTMEITFPADCKSEQALKIQPSEDGKRRKIISSDYVFLAAGAEPSVPNIPGLNNTPYLTSTEALRLRKLPEKIIVIGGGYIATELGHMFGGLGSEMHLFARSQLLRTMDKDAREEFAKVFDEKYNLHTGVEFRGVEFEEATHQFTLTYTENGNKSDEKKIQADQLLVCTGVTPVGEKLGLEESGVTAMKKGGFVDVRTLNADPTLRTSKPGIWAFGDCIGNYLFRHCANFEGEYLLENVIYPMAKSKGLIKDPTILGLLNHVNLPEDAATNPTKFAESLHYPPLDYNQGMPWAVFSNPQVAGIGFSEDELQNVTGDAKVAQTLTEMGFIDQPTNLVEGKDYVKGLNYYKNSAMGDARRSDHGFVKVLVSTKDRRILGCVMVGYEASTMIHMVTPVMKNRGKLEDLLGCIFVHPALPEILRNACRKARDALVKVEGCEVPLKLRLK